MNELRSLRDLGIYEGRITVDHADLIGVGNRCGNGEHDVVKIDRHIAGRNSRESPAESIGDVKLESILPSQSSSVIEPPRQSLQEGGINFSLLKV